MTGIVIVVLAGWALCVTALLIGLVIRSEDRETALNRRIQEQAEELAVWRGEEDEKEDVRFDASIQKLCALEDERTAERIVAALGLDRAATKEIVLRELRRAFLPDEKEAAA